ncbi:MAG: IclR family transcriptional regulator [Terrimesophilobacter sp.]
MTSQTTPHSQTLSRGVRMLEILAEATGPLSIAELSTELGVHRSIAYRILRTLEDHRMVVRDASGAVKLGPQLAALARGVSRDLQSAALPELTAVAQNLSMTAFLVVLDRDECVTLVSVEPRHANGSVAQRPGTRHPLSVGAPGIAIQSGLSDDEVSSLLPGRRVRPEVFDARNNGFATSHGEVIPGVSSVSVPLTIPGQPPAAISVVFVTSGTPADSVSSRLLAAAEAIAGEFA